MFGGIRKSIGGKIYEQLGRANSHVQKTRPMPVDVLEGEDDYLIVFDVPGAETDDVEVRYHNGTVRVRVVRYRDFYDGFDLRFPGRSMQLDGEADLPADAVVDAEAATARLGDAGTIRIEIPKERPEDSGHEAEEIPIDD